MTKVNTLQREEAEEMRRNGKSIKEIAERLQRNKSTVSYWCRDITLSKSQISLLAERSNSHGTRALLMASERRRQKRISDTKSLRKKGKQDIGRLTKRDLFMVGLALYWGEGYKKGSEEFGFTNSDPKIIMTFLRWLRKIYDVKPNDLILRVSINNQHEYRINNVLRFWTNITNVPLSQFTKTSLIKTPLKKQYKNHMEHYGTLRIKVRRGTNLRRRVLASIEAVSKN